jgi:hypothetical protein
MKNVLLLLSVIGFCLSCSSLPRVYPSVDLATPQAEQACRDLFPKGDWQFWHSIEATLPGGQKGFLMGLTVISSANRTAHCVIMTQEGFVLFDAFYDEEISVERAVAPFDSEAFAKGLISDIQLIFFTPNGSPSETGYDKDGASICRYHIPDGRLVDLVMLGDRSWKIRQYSRQTRLERTVSAFSNQQYREENRHAIADRLELTACGAAGYSLIMDLIEAVPLGH